MKRKRGSQVYSTTSFSRPHSSWQDLFGQSKQAPGGSQSDFGSARAIYGDKGNLRRRFVPFMGLQVEGKGALDRGQVAPEAVEAAAKMGKFLPSWGPPESQLIISGGGSSELLRQFAQKMGMHPDVLAKANDAEIRRVITERMGGDKQGRLIGYGVKPLAGYAPPPVPTIAERRAEQRRVEQREFEQRQLREMEAFRVRLDATYNEYLRQTQRSNREKARDRQYQARMETLLKGIRDRPDAISPAQIQQLYGKLDELKEAVADDEILSDVWKAQVVSLLEKIAAQQKNTPRPFPTPPPTPSLSSPEYRPSYSSDEGGDLFSPGTPVGPSTAPGGNPAPMTGLQNRSAARNLFGSASPVSSPGPDSPVPESSIVQPIPRYQIGAEGALSINRPPPYQMGPRSSSASSSSPALSTPASVPAPSIGGLQTPIGTGGSLAPQLNAGPRTSNVANNFPTSAPPPSESPSASQYGESPADPEFEGEGGEPSAPLPQKKRKVWYSPYSTSKQDQYTKPPDRVLENWYTYAQKRFDMAGSTHDKGWWNDYLWRVEGYLGFQPGKRYKSGPGLLKPRIRHKASERTPPGGWKD